MSAKLIGSISLTSSEWRWLVRLAREADCPVEVILRDALRDGFEYTEYRIRAVNEASGDRSAGRMISLAWISSRRESRGDVPIDVPDDQCPRRLSEQACEIMIPGA